MLDSTYKMMDDWTRPEHLSEDELERTDEILALASKAIFEVALEFNDLAHYRQIPVDDHERFADEISGMLEDNRKNTCEKRMEAKERRERYQETLIRAQYGLTVTDTDVF